ncbi:apoptotic chromatin condensation inducer in the nucleus isoform X2 [Leptopilina boulardi]|uniref:apoptotic chromatin condensation inducer in the nucleus isoform X2 n=1 Tax=Leptopilina boulardi TaxID=63433 RepID=UPI0021F6165E|nr:apoptotic chromatin condensation inducer in the nucleus isoform X2 [Leptopilina boulardi]
MRRKSERNKTKGSPEKKIEKPTRKSARRRGKRATSSSPERDDSQEDTTSDASLSRESNKELTRLQNKDLKLIPEQSEMVITIPNVEEKDSSPETEDNGSVWKVARADASPDHNICGEPDVPIQQEVEGECEEVDNQDNQQQIIENAEIDRKEEQIPEDETANPKEDVQQDIQIENQEEITEIKEKTFDELNSNVQLSPKEDDIEKEESQIQEEIEVVPKEIEIVPKVIEIVEATIEKDEESHQKDEVTSEKDDRNDSSSDEDEVKVHSDSNSIDEAQMNVRSSIRVTSRSNRRKNRSKYRESSYSDTPESEDDPSLERKSKQPETPENEEEEEPLSRDKDFHRDRRSRSKSLEPNDNSSLLNSQQREEQIDEENEKNENSSIINLEAITSSQKPAKINLKRTFGTRNSADEVKVEESNQCEKIDSHPVKTNHANENTEQKRVPKRRRWGTTLSTDSSIEFSVSTDSLKVLVPGAKPLSITEVRLSKDIEEEQFRDKNRDKHNNDSNGEYIVREEIIASKNERKGDTKADNHMGSRRKISVVKDIPQTMLTSPSIVKATNILLIKNLVRPFTLTQIKELLSRTGTILENGFWMDRIKSKCYVQYSNEDQAFETRQALHGISWPLSNPKKLQVEYATKEDMELAQESSQEITNSRKDDNFGQADSWQHDWIREERNQTGGVKVTVVREWDLGKEDGQQHVIKDEREKKEMEKKKRQRSQTPVTEIHLPAPARKFKKKEDEPPPAKLLDDLFRKTKATPCIYWLPLTNEQIVVKEEMRRQHMAEHARRLEEMRRAERNRDHRRRRTPRK